MNFSSEGSPVYMFWAVETPLFDPVKKTYSVERIEMSSKVMLQLNFWWKKPILTSIRICSRYFKLYRKHNPDSANVTNLFFQRTLLCLYHHFNFQMVGSEDFLGDCLFEREESLSYFLDQSWILNMLKGTVSRKLRPRLLYINRKLFL